MSSAWGNSWGNAWGNTWVVGQLWTVKPDNPAAWSVQTNVGTVWIVL